MIDCMMTTVQARVNDTLKQTADGILKSVGLDLSTAIRMFLTAVVNEHGLPFQVKSPWYVSEDGEVWDFTVAELDEAIAESYDESKLSPPFNTTEEFVAHLKSVIENGE